MPHRSKRLLLACGLAGLLATMASACGGGGSTSTPSGETEITASVSASGGDGRR